MGGSPRRILRRACFVAASVCLLLAIVIPSSPAQEEDGLRPEVFRGAASSQVASVQVDRDALLPIADLFRFIALDGSATYESSTRQARASLLFPGNGLILGPGLACGTFGKEFPPELKPILDLCLQYQYPLTVFADDFAPDGATGGSFALGAPGDPVSANGVGAKAHAGEDASTTEAAVQDLRVLGLPGLGAINLPILGLKPDSLLLTVENATSRTNQRIVDGVLTIDAEATLTGVRLLGGLIKIGALQSESHVTDDAKGNRTSTATVATSDVTVAGLAAQITDQGLVLGSSGGGGPLVDQLLSLVNGLLQAVHLEVTLLDAEENTDDSGSAVANAGGLLIELALPVQGLPTIPGPIGDLDPNGTYVASVQLGTTAARGAAYAFDPVETKPTGIRTPSVGAGGGTNTGGGPVGRATPSTSGGSPSTPTTAAPAEPETLPEQLVQNLGGLFGNRIGLVYLSLMLATLGLCIVPRLTVPARLPGAQS